jgi:hypothetical protein
MGRCDDVLGNIRKGPNASPIERKKEAADIQLTASMEQNSDQHCDRRKCGANQETQYHNIIAFAAQMLVAQPHKFLDCFICRMLQLGPRQIIKGLATPIDHSSNLHLVRSSASGMPRQMASPDGIP